MKRSAAPILLILLLAAPGGVTADELSLRAGAAAVDISPREFPLNMPGGFSANMATGVHDPLHSRAIVLDNGNTTLAMVVVDSLGVAPEAIEEAKQIAAEKTGIAPESMLICSTHTHSAPPSGGGDGPAGAYRRLIVAGMADSIIEAHAAAEAEGKGVVLAETYKAAESVIQAFMGLEAEIMVQEFIREAKGADIRCFVVGGKVVASMKRQAGEGEFRSNLHRGGQASLIRITPEERSTAVRAAKVMGLNVAGVDLLRSNHGPVVMEVNSSPGLKGIETASGKDIAGQIVEFIEKNARQGRTKTRGKG